MKQQTVSERKAMSSDFDNKTFDPGTVLDDRIRRISYYEELLRKAEEILKDSRNCAASSDNAYAIPGSISGAADSATAAPDCTTTSLAGMIRELDAYYGSREWREDLAADEAGELPEDLRRGVLSEDGIWNVLQEYRERTAAGEEPEQ